MPKNGESFSEKLEKILNCDRKCSFVKLLKKNPEEATKALVEKCAEMGAKKCLVALLSGDICEPPPQLDAAHLTHTATALAMVAHAFPDDPHLINLMLSRCAAHPLVNVCCTIGSVHGLPLHFVLVHLSFVDHLFRWSRGNSLLDLIALLCQWKTKPILDSVRLLAQHTESINSTSWTFVKNGGMKQLGALLLVSREKVMVPFESGLTIRDYITCEIDSFSEGDISTEQAEYKNMLIDSRQLIDVFERAGDALSFYCSSMQKNVPVHKVLLDVSVLLKKALVHVSISDLHLYYYFSYRTNRGYEYSWKLSGPHEPDMGKYLFAVPAGGVKRNHFYVSSCLSRPKTLPVPNIVSSGSQPRLFSTIAWHCSNSNKSQYNGATSILNPWTLGDSICKLVILLCQWKTKPGLDSALLLTRYTRSVNEVAWSYVANGRLVELGALLLFAREKVVVPFDSGLTLQQRINDVFDAISSEGDRYSDYKSMLGDACKLLDIFERAGDCLSVYCSSMHKPVPPENVLVDVTGILKKAGFLLQSVDLDLRDNSRGHPQLCKTNLFKLSDLPSPDPYATRAQGSGTTRDNSSYHWDLLQRLKSGTMLNLASSGPLPRLFSTASHHHGSSSSLLHLAYAALKLKRGSRFL